MSGNCCFWCCANARESIQSTVRFYAKHCKLASPCKRTTRPFGLICGKFKRQKYTRPFGLILIIQTERWKFAEEFLVHRWTTSELGSSNLDCLIELELPRRTRSGFMGEGCKSCTRQSKFEEPSSEVVPPVFSFLVLFLAFIKYAPLDLGRILDMTDNPVECEPLSPASVP